MTAAAVFAAMAAIWTVGEAREGMEVDSKPEVKRSGAALLNDIREADPPHGSIAFWWLGQSSFIYKGEAVVYIDPYLSVNPARQTPPALKPEESTNADLVLCTHDHGDHIDPGTLPGLAKASPTAIFIVPRKHVERVAKLGISHNRIIGLSDGESVTRGRVTVTAIKSKHEFFDADPKLGFPHLGYVVEMNGFRFYHAGDGIPYEGLVGALRQRKPDALFLPINGRDGAKYRRNLIGNFTFQESVDLAGEVNPSWAIPMHWDMFRGNQEDPARFTDYLDAKFPAIRAWVGAVGDRVIIDKSTDG